MGSSLSTGLITAMVIVNEEEEEEEEEEDVQASAI